MRMSPEKWEAILPEEKEVLKNLGLLSLVKPKGIALKSQGKPKLKPKPYILKRTTTCLICKSVLVQYFRMASLEKQSFLTGVEVKEKDILPGEPMKEESSTFKGCYKCYVVLGRESKEELIYRIIKLAKRG